MSEQQWDRLLKIKTSGRDDSRSDRFHYPYEPTPYPVLLKMAGQGYITKRNIVLDYGCGKGRVGFFLSWQVRCRCIGIEYDERIYRAALRNKETAVSGSKVEICKVAAESYVIPASVDRLYFFNPFSSELLMRVIERVRDSWYEEPREILLFFYYPSDEYVACLMTVNELEFLDEIDCRDLFDGEDMRERILIFRMDGGQYNA